MGDPKLVQSPIAVAIDTTGFTTKANKDVIKELFSDLQIKKASSYHLVTFKDRVKKINSFKNDVEFLSKVNDIKFGGGLDPAEAVLKGQLKEQPRIFPSFPWLP